MPGTCWLWIAFLIHQKSPSWSCSMLLYLNPVWPDITYQSSNLSSGLGALPDKAQNCVFNCWVYSTSKRPTRPFRTNTPKRCPFHYKVLECKSTKSRNTWSYRQIWPWSAEWSRAKAKRVLPRERNGHSKPDPTTQGRLYTRTSPNGQYWNQIDYILCSQRWKSSIYCQQKQDWELTVAQIMNSLLPNSDLNWRKWGKPLDHSGMT